MVLAAWCSSQAALKRRHECARLQVGTTPPPMALPYNREAQLHTAPDHYLLVVPPLLQVCNLFRKSGTNHPSYIHNEETYTGIFIFTLSDNRICRPF